MGRQERVQAESCKTASNLVTWCVCPSRLGRQHTHLLVLWVDTGGAVIHSVACLQIGSGNRCRAQQGEEA